MPSDDLNYRPLQMTRSERRRRDAQHRRRQYLRRLSTMGILSGLSVSSFLYAHMVKGTHALLTGTATARSNAFQAAKHFQSWDDQQASAAQSATAQVLQHCRRAGQILAEIRSADSSSDARALVPELLSELSAAQAALQDAEAAYQVITSAASEDQQDYQQVLDAAQSTHVNVGQLDSLMSSYQRVIDWSSSAAKRASAAVSSASSALADASSLRRAAGRAIEDKVAAEKAEAEKAAGDQTGANQVGSGKITVDSAGGKSESPATEIASSDESDGNDARTGNEVASVPVSHDVQNTSSSVGGSATTPSDTASSSK